MERQLVSAAPLYRRAEVEYAAEGNIAKALYAKVSQIPGGAESTSLADTIYVLTQDLSRPEAADAETRLRILLVRGMIENNYDAGMARQTWKQVADRATRQGHLLLASRALGEQGIAAFLAGDTTTAKREVLAAWGVSKVFRDTGAHVRYASLYGAGLVELHRYNEALIALNEAINTAKSSPAVAFPAVAVSSKIDALRGLHRYQERSFSQAKLSRRSLVLRSRGITTKSSHREPVCMRTSASGTMRSPISTRLFRMRRSSAIGHLFASNTSTLHWEIHCSGNSSGR